MPSCSCGSMQAIRAAEWGHSVPAASCAVLPAPQLSPSTSKPGANAVACRWLCRDAGCNLYGSAQGDGSCEGKSGAVAGGLGGVC